MYFKKRLLERKIPFLYIKEDDHTLPCQDPLLSEDHQRETEKPT